MGLGRQHYHLAVYDVGLRAGLHFWHWAKKMTQTILIVMDIQLPEQSGLELTRLPRADARHGHLPIIAVTAFTDMCDDPLIREAGCNDFPSKPISVTTFQETIERHLPKPH